MSDAAPHPSSPADAIDRREAVGTRFSRAAMQTARHRSVAAVQAIADAIEVGMSEAEAGELGLGILHLMGMERSWHPVIVRFGAGTLKTFRQRSAPGTRLRQDDIFFVDIGPVWAGHEGDAGDTFVVGTDPEMRACADAARALWHDVAAHWRATGCTGQALYRHAAQLAHARGWALNLDIQGHRVGDYPHAVHRAGDLGALDRPPASGLWILEIQIAHPRRPFGAFFEDLLDARAA